MVVLLALQNRNICDESAGAGPLGLCSVLRSPGLWGGSWSLWPSMKGGLTVVFGAVSGCTLAQGEWPLQKLGCRALQPGPALPTCPERRGDGHGPSQQWPLPLLRPARRQFGWFPQLDVTHSPLPAGRASCTCELWTWVEGSVLPYSGAFRTVPTLGLALFRALVLVMGIVT